MRQSKVCLEEWFINEMNRTTKPLLETILGQLANSNRIELLKSIIKKRSSSLEEKSDQIKNIFLVLGQINDAMHLIEFSSITPLLLEAIKSQMEIYFIFNRSEYTTEEKITFETHVQDLFALQYSLSLRFINDFRGILIKYNATKEEEPNLNIIKRKLGEYKATLNELRVSFSRLLKEEGVSPEEGAITDEMKSKAVDQSKFRLEFNDQGVLKIGKRIFRKYPSNSNGYKILQRLFQKSLLGDSMERVTLSNKEFEKISSDSKFSRVMSNMGFTGKLREIFWDQSDTKDLSLNLIITKKDLKKHSLTDQELVSLFAKTRGFKIQPESEISLN